jgi:organic radical activating enzyme
MNKDTFCSLPFTEIFLGPDGVVKPCCSSRIGLGSLHLNPIDEILQSRESRSIRQSIIEGKWHSACFQCMNQEAQGARSERADNLEDFVEQFGNVDNTFFALRRLDLRWSNTCNLSCVYCYEYFSSKWAHIKGIKVNTIKDENTESLLLLIEKEKDNIQTILMLGGEPLLQKQNQRLVESLTGKSFYILTNLAVPIKTNPTAQKLLKEPSSGWGVSFETVGDRFEYVRHGAEWSVLNENIDYYNEIRGVDDCSNFRLEAHSMYSIYSAFNLVEFYEFILEKKFKYIHWNLLESSGESSYASVLNLPLEFRQMAIKEIERVETLYPNGPGVESLIPYKEILSRNNGTEDFWDKEQGKWVNSSEINVKKLFLQEFNKVESSLKDKTKKFKDLWPTIYSMLNS